MKHVFIASLVAAACTANADASPFGPDYGFDEVYGPVDRGREAAPDADPAWLAEVFEHVISPEASLQSRNRKEQS